MTPLDRAVHDITTVLESLQIEYAIVGGIANAIWGEPRATIAVDVTVSVDEERLPATVPALAERFRPAVENPVAFVQQTRVLPLDTDDGVRIDVILRAPALRARRDSTGLREVPEARADRAPGGVDAGDQDQADRSKQMIFADRLPVDLRRRKLADQIVGWRGAALLDLGLEYLVVSPIAFIRMSGRVMPSSRISWIHCRKRSPSLSGRPSITAMTRTGISCA